MATYTGLKHERTKYKYVYKIMQGGESFINKTSWLVKMSGLQKWCSSEREAAMKVDIHLISKGKAPINILKKL